MDTPISLLNLICTQNNTKSDYTLLSREGQVHLPTFTYQVKVNDYSEEASGQSKKKAKHLAAKKMILCLLNDPNIVIREDRKNILENLKNVDESVDSLGQQQTTKNESADSKIDSIVKEKTSMELGNPIGKLQEICMKKHWHPPIYEEAESKGLPHERMFTFKCRIENMNLVIFGCGKSKKSAKREAAEKMLSFLRDEHLDKVDEILDRIPKNSTFIKDKKEGSFNLRTEIMLFQANRDKNRLEESKLHSFFKDLHSNRTLLENIKNLIPDIHEFIQKYVSGIIVANIDKVMQNIANLLKCDLIIEMHPQKSQIDQYQYWAELISIEEPYNNLSILSAWGTDDKMQIARQKALSRLLLILVCSI